MYWIGELIPILAIVFVIGVPVTALAAHFVLRPLVRDITVVAVSPETCFLQKTRPLS